MDEKDIENSTIKFLIEDIGWSSANILEIQKRNNNWKIVVEAYEYISSKKISIFYSIIVSEQFHIISIDRI